MYYYWMIFRNMSLSTLVRNLRLTGMALDMSLRKMSQFHVRELTRG
jgi:hypothetical protein